MASVYVCVLIVLEADEDIIYCAKVDKCANVLMFDKAWG